MMRTLVICMKEHSSLWLHDNRKIVTIKRHDESPTASYYTKAFLSGRTYGANFIDRTRASSARSERNLRQAPAWQGGQCTEGDGSPAGGTQDLSRFLLQCGP